MNPLTKGMAKRLVIRRFTTGDVDAVSAIEAAVSLDPWSRELFAGELDEQPGDRFPTRRSGQRSDRHWLVALDGRSGPVIGFGGVLFVVDEVHVMNVAVSADARRRGVASRLLVELLANAVGRGAMSATLEVRPANVAAIGLYRRFGFTEVGRRPRYYPNGDDAVIMWAHHLSGVVQRWRSPVGAIR